MSQSVSSTFFETGLHSVSMVRFGFYISTFGPAGYVRKYIRFKYAANLRYLLDLSCRAARLTVSICYLLLGRNNLLEFQSSRICGPMCMFSSAGGNYTRP